MFDGGFRRRGSRNVPETATERVGEPHQAPERVASGLDAMPVHERPESRRGGNERARVHEVPVGEGVCEGADLLPGRGVQAIRQRGRSGRLDRRAGGDLQRSMRLVDVENVPGIAEAVPFAAQAPGRMGLDPEAKQPLPRLVRGSRHSSIVHRRTWLS